MSFPPPPIKSPISQGLVSADWARWFSNLNQGIAGSLPVPFTLGDTLYASGTLNLAKLAGNISTTRKFLTQTGTGAVSAAPSWRPIGADDIPDAIIINPLALGRNVIRPASNAIEGLAIKAFSSPVSYLASANWTTQGGGLVFGATIDQNPAAIQQTSYAYAPIADMANLHITFAYSVTDTKNSSVSNYACLGGAGVVGRNLTTTNPPHNQSGTGSPYGAWTSDTVGSIRHFIGTNNTGIYISSPLIEDQVYTGTITITVGPNKGLNKYDVTVRTQLPFASIDHTEIITDGIDNGGAGTNGYLVIAGSYTPTTDNAYSVSSILTGSIPTQKSFEVRKDDNTVEAYIDWDGTGSFYDILASHHSTLGTVISGIWQGTSIDTAYTDAKVKTVTGTANRISIGGTATDPTFNISTAYVGQGTITTLGTITSGVWNGTSVTVPFGGTGVATLASNGMLYGNGTGVVQALAVNSSATNKFLTQSSSGAPAWNTIAASDLPSSFSGLANPSGTIGLSAVNGAATTALRSDGTHALSQAIVPTWSGIHTFSAQPILSTLSVSQAVFSDGSKGLVSNAITGTGNVVMSASPTLTGTITASAVVLSSSLSLTYNDAIVTVGNGVGAPDIRSNGASGSIRALSLQTGSVDRWKVYSNATAETGSAAGSNFRLTAYDDSGASIDNPIAINRVSGGTMTLARPVSMSSTLAITSTVGVGGNSATTVGLIIGSGLSSLTGTQQAGIHSTGTMNSAATLSGWAIRAELRTQAAAFTMATGVGVRIEDGNKGAGSTITNLIGLDIANQTAGATNYAIRTGTGSVQFGGLTASQAVFSDSSKNLVSNAITGTGNVVMSASPTLSGLIGGNLEWSGTQDFDARIGFAGNGTGSTASIWREAANGMVLRGVSGSSNQLQIQNKSGTAIVSWDNTNGYPTLTGNLTLTGTATISSTLVVGATSGSSQLDIIGGSGASSGLRIGTNQTDATNKEGRIKAYHYTNSEEPVTLAWVSSQSASSALNIGGGSSAENALTAIDFYTAANNTTVSGTRRGGFDSAGVFDVVSNILSAASIKLSTAGGGFYVKEGTNASMGVATLVLGVATVSTNKVTANSRIFLSVESLGTIASPVAVSVTARTAGTSFTITSANLTDTSSIAWLIMEPA